MKDGLLAISEGLASNTDEAAQRHAVSTAYYAAFHCLCELVATSLVEDQDSDLYTSVYRKLKHKILDQKTLFGFDHVVANVQTTLNDLRQHRETADYIPGKFPLDETEVGSLITKARSSIALLGSLDPKVRRELAVRLLIAKP